MGPEHCSCIMKNAVLLCTVGYLGLTTDALIILMTLLLYRNLGHASVLYCHSGLSHEGFISFMVFLHTRKVT